MRRNLLFRMMWVRIVQCHTCKNRVPKMSRCIYLLDNLQIIMSVIQAELMGRNAVRLFLHSYVSQRCGTRCIPSTRGSSRTGYHFPSNITSFSNDLYIKSFSTCKSSESESAELVGSESTDILVTEGGKVMKHPTGYRLFAMVRFFVLQYIMFSWKQQPHCRHYRGNRVFRMAALC